MDSENQNLDQAEIKSEGQENLEAPKPDFEKLLESQSKQIEILSKQLEKANLVNQQLNKTMDAHLKNIESKNQDPFEWVNKKASSAEGTKTFFRDKEMGNGINERFLNFYIKVLKDYENVENKKIGERLNDILKFTSNQ